MRVKPTSPEEQRLRTQGYVCIAGVDEAGCGALAGPVVAGAVVLPVSSTLPVYDSKQLSAKRREALYEAIVNEAVAYGVGIIEASEIDRIGIRPATLLAMRSALMACEGVDYALVDAWTIPNILVSQKGLIRGDATERLIAAASILAKVTRDRLMVACASEFPSYGFAVHKGYGTAAHRAAIRQHGMSPLHRKTFTCL